MLYEKKLFFPILIFLFYSCGGVVGNIEKYRFIGISSTSLKTAVSKVLIKYPDLSILDTIKYQERKKQINDLGDYCIAIENKDTFIFIYAYPDYGFAPDSIAEIALISAAKVNEPLKLSKDMGFFRKREYRKLFEKFFIEKIKAELGYKGN